MNILVIEDDPEVIETIKLCISIRWPQSTVVASTRGQQGLSQADVDRPDLVLLDLKLPDMDGLDVLREIRLFSPVPVLIVTARGDELSRVKGLELGADDYIVKPFSHTELLARINAVVRRTYNPQVFDGKATLVGGNLTVDMVQRRVYKGDLEINLTPTEWSLLSYLVRNEGKIVPHQVVAERVWGSQSISDSAIKMSVHRLRQKLGDDPQTPKIIHSHRGLGYRFEMPK